MADGGISERGSKRGTSLFMKSPDRRLTAPDSKQARATVASPSGKASDFHSDIKELIKNKQPSSLSVNSAR